MSQSELLLMMTYVLGATEGNFDCLNRVACEDSKKAKEYLNAAKMVLKGAKFAQKWVKYPTFFLSRAPFFSKKVG